MYSKLSILSYNCIRSQNLAYCIYTLPNIILEQTHMHKMCATNCVFEPYTYYIYGTFSRVVCIVMALTWVISPAIQWHRKCAHFQHIHSHFDYLSLIYIIFDEQYEGGAYMFSRPNEHFFFFFLHFFSCMVLYVCHWGCCANAKHFLYAKHW